MSRLEDTVGKLSSSKSLARLFSGEITEQEAIVIRRNITGDPSFHDNFKAAASVIAGMDSLADDPDIIAIANQSRPKLVDVARNHWKVMSAVAALLVMAVGITAFFSGKQIGAGAGANMQRYATRIGEQKTVTLQDGSIVTLNTGSVLLVDITSSGRHLTLTRGEAFFDVERDTNRPFTVDMGARSVTVLGTRFNVLKLPDKYQVAVVEGVVAIHEIDEVVSPIAPLLTAPEGERVQINKPTQRRISAGWVAEYDLVSGSMTGHVPESIKRLHSWRTGLIEFYDEPLFKVVQRLNRYSGKKILIEDADIMSLSVYAGINVKELGGAMIGLEKILPIKITTHFDRIVIVGSRSND